MTGICGNVFTDPPMNLHLEEAKETHLKFSWDSAFPTCPPFSYNIRTANCGSCPESANSSTVLCENPNLSEVCSIAVQTRCDEKIGSMSSILQVMDYNERFSTTGSGGKHFNFINSNVIIISAHVQVDQMIF